MSYNKNLGKVKGDTGTAYIPEIKLDTTQKRQYVVFTSNDGTPLPAILQGEKNLTNYMFIPQYDTENGNLSFYLGSPTDADIELANQGWHIKGEPGQVTLKTTIVPTLPNADEAKEDVLYVLLNDEGTYCDVVVFKDGEPYYFDNPLRFSNYYTKQETMNTQGIKDYIDERLGIINYEIEDINSILGDVGAIQIPNDE